MQLMVEIGKKYLLEGKEVEVTDISDMFVSYKPGKTSEVGLMSPEKFQCLLTGTEEDWEKYLELKDKLKNFILEDFESFQIEECLKNINKAERKIND